MEGVETRMTDSRMHVGDRTIDMSDVHYWDLQNVGMQEVHELFLSLCKRLISPKTFSIILFKKKKKEIANGWRVTSLLCACSHHESLAAVVEDSCKLHSPAVLHLHHWPLHANSKLLLLLFDRCRIADNFSLMSLIQAWRNQEIQVLINPKKRQQQQLTNHHRRDLEARCAHLFILLHVIFFLRGYSYMSLFRSKKERGKNQTKGLVSLRTIMIKKRGKKQRWKRNGGDAGVSFW